MLKYLYFKITEKIAPTDQVQYECHNDNIYFLEKHS